MTRDKQKKKSKSSSSESATESSTTTTDSPGSMDKKSKARGKGKGKSSRKGKTGKISGRKGKKAQKGKKSLKGRKGLKGKKGLKGRKGLKGLKSPYAAKKSSLSQIVNKRPSGKRWRPGQKAIREIMELQNTHHLLMRKLPFARAVKAITRDSFSRERGQIRWRKNALICLQEATENYIIDFLSDTNLSAIHARRVTIMDRDVHLVQRLKGMNKHQK
ncbi:histone H3-like centromeric protein a [Anaeramoeba flamelloides]|uniref:Histone H3-like centromeric protein a n=1 Tax=Anaeramoeba flamelloides TaxID=1746091 RepID=A0AAV7Z261_9EUKA|nr:histone H3-like centromeric protein a [Anaeramoeba flamelloides]